MLGLLGTEHRRVGRRQVVVARVRAWWPQTVDFDRGVFVNTPEEEEPYIPIGTGTNER